MRGKTYKGCGFHYGQEKSLGVLLRDLNNFDQKLEGDQLLVLEVIYEDLVETVTGIETELAR